VFVPGAMRLRCVRDPGSMPLHVIRVLNLAVPRQVSVAEVERGVSYGAGHRTTFK